MPRHGNAPGGSTPRREEHDRADLILHPRATSKTLRETYVEKIGTAWQKATSDVIDAGLALLEAKDELSHGEFLSMIETDLPFSARTAQRLMAIAGNQVLIDATHVSLLPPAWGTLYELTRLSEPELKRAIAAGAVHPKMERKDVAALLRPSPPASKAVIDVTAVPVNGKSSPAQKETLPPVGPPRNGMDFARMALMDLEQIRPDDAERLEAFASITAWLDERAGQKTMPMQTRATLAARSAACWHELQEWEQRHRKTLGTLRMKGVTADYFATFRKIAYSFETDPKSSKQAKSETRALQVAPSSTQRDKDDPKVDPVVSTYGDSETAAFIAEEEARRAALVTRAFGSKDQGGPCMCFRCTVRAARGQGPLHATPTGTQAAAGAVGV